MTLTFFPSKLEAVVKKWDEKGLMTFLLYLQLRHYEQKHKEWDKLYATPSKIDHLFMLTMNGKIISHIYKILQEDSLDIKEKCELEMNTIILG